MKGGVEFLVAIDALGFTQREFAMLLGQLGDPRAFPTRERWVHRLASAGTAAVPGEAVALLNLLGQMQKMPIYWTRLMRQLDAVSVRQVGPAAAK